MLRPINVLFISMLVGLLFLSIWRAHWCSPGSHAAEATSVASYEALLQPQELPNRGVGVGFDLTAGYGWVMAHRTKMLCCLLTACWQDRSNQLSQWFNGERGKSQCQRDTPQDYVTALPHELSLQGVSQASLPSCSRLLTDVLD